MKLKLPAHWLFLLTLYHAPLFAQVPGFQQLFDEHGAVMLLINPASGEIVDANPAAAMFYGFTRDELKTKSIQQINTLSNDQVATERALAAREGRNYFIFRHKIANGEIRTVEVNSHPFVFNGQRLLLSIIHDITPGRNIEQGLWHYQQRLEELVAQRTHELESRSRWLLAALLLTVLIASALIVAWFRRRRVEVALAYRQGVFSALFEQSGFLAGVLDSDGRLLEVNQRALQLIGQPASAVIGQPFVDTPWWLETDKPRLREALACAAAGQAASFEATHPGSDGQTITVLFHALPVAIGDARYTSVIGVDISEKRQYETELEWQRRRLNDILTGTNVGTWEWNVQTGAVVFNARWAEMIGYSLAELEPVSIETWMKFTHPDDLKVSGELLERHFAGELSFYECEARMRHKDGSWIWVLDRGKVASRTEDGKPLLMSGTHQDITERKEAEQRLRESELVLRTSIDAIGEAFVIFDPEDRLIFCNEKYREVYPSVADIIQPGTTFEQIVRTWAERGHADLGDGDIESWVAERLAKHKSGQILIQHTETDHWVRIVERLTPSGHIVGFRVDISELMKAKTEAEAANLAKSRFLATMSHEIRTPMNGILGMAQLLLGPAMTDTDRRDCARTILNSGQTLLTLLNDILDLSKVEAGKLSLEMSVVDPQQILHETQALFFDNAKAKGLRIDVSWSGPAASRYRGDPHRLRQMLSNLVNNAIKFTVQGEIRLTGMELKGEDASSLLEFSVTDTGIGIPAEKLALLFKPFSQADSSISRQFGGSGLGLSIVSSLARLMGGDVGVSSEPGKGSRFWFRVRAERVAENEDSRQWVRNDATTVIEQHHPQLQGRVLIVEDNPTNQLVLNALLPKNGMQTLLAENGQEAIECIIERGERVDAILMDLQMPVMDGYEATRRIRAWEKANERPAIPIIALTADAFPEDREHCLRLGMDDFIAKPIMIDDLLRSLGRFLGTGAVPPTSGQAASRSLDRQRFLEVANALLPLLAQGRFDVIERFAELESLATDTPEATSLHKIRQALDAFRFEQAQEALTALLNQLTVQDN